ncbi:hypothetical protein GUJ93_ZPchr0012g20968 [Zizania palustris]|uniref:Uncharacterized protein n=1 Tax=Zizania palustris TaxID=103762 RepID=A0A8J6BSI2_ZIZPA|nr:hypothetical protein GUJ93_ZPchr0012g20968 [Zizania palustris]
MVVALGVGQFYGGGLPRPRFFSGGGDRVDPPAPVSAPLLDWAHEAHWSMGGLSYTRLRLQGRIEGSIDKLRCRARRDARVAAKARTAGLKPGSLAPLGSDDGVGDSDEDDVEAQERILKREVVDEPSEEQEDTEEEEEALATIAAAAKRKRNRKLSDEFDRVATLPDGMAKKQKPAAATPARTSPTTKGAEAAPTPAPVAPTRSSPRRKAAETAPMTAAVAPAKASRKRKASAAAAAASTPVTGPRRTSPRTKH